MSDQPDALYLADVLENDPQSKAHHDAAVSCLRRQHAEIDRLSAEVANRNRRAIAGDEAVAALNNVHAYYEGLEAERDALLKALVNIMPLADFGAAEQSPPYADEHLLNAAQAAIAKAEAGNDE